LGSGAIKKNNRFHRRFQSINNRYLFGDEDSEVMLSPASGAIQEGQAYYQKFIHEKNQQQMLRASLDKKSEQFVPYEAGRKIPINERVQFYMQKLQEEEDAKNG
jgi:hypothetical protein